MRRATALAQFSELRMVGFAALAALRVDEVKLRRPPMDEVSPARSGWVKAGFSAR